MFIVLLLAYLSLSFRFIFLLCSSVSLALYFCFWSLRFSLSSVNVSPAESDRLCKWCICQLKTCCWNEDVRSHQSLYDIPWSTPLTEKKKQQLCDKLVLWSIHTHKSYMRHWFCDLSTHKTGISHWHIPLLFPTPFPHKTILTIHITAAGQWIKM